MYLSALDLLGMLSCIFPATLLLLWYVEFLRFIRECVEVELPCRDFQILIMFRLEQIHLIVPQLLSQSSKSATLLQLQN